MCTRSTMLVISFHERCNFANKVMTGCDLGTFLRCVQLVTRKFFFRYEKIFALCILSSSDFFEMCLKFHLEGIELGKEKQTRKFKCFLNKFSRGVFA